MKGDILLDVDGVLNPCPFLAANCPDWVFEPSFKSTKTSGRYTLNLSRQMADAITNLSCRILWLTTWGTHAHANMGLHFDWISHPVLAERPEPEQVYEGMYGWRSVEDFNWKPRAVQAHLAQPGPKVVWIDDDIEGFMRDPRFSGQALDPHGRLLTICPETDVGLTRNHIEQIRSFLS